MLPDSGSWLFDPDVPIWGTTSFPFPHPFPFMFYQHQTDVVFSPPSPTSDHHWSGSILLVDFFLSFSESSFQIRKSMLKSKCGKMERIWDELFSSSFFLPWYGKTWSESGSFLKVDRVSLFLLAGHHSFSCGNSSVPRPLLSQRLGLPVDSQADRTNRRESPQFISYFYLFLFFFFINSIYCQKFCSHKIIPHTFHSYTPSVTFHHSSDGKYPLFLSTKCGNFVACASRDGRWKQRERRGRKHEEFESRNDFSIVELPDRKKRAQRIHTIYTIHACMQFGGQKCSSRQKIKSNDKHKR